MSQEARKIKEFTDLFAWQESHKLVVMIHTMTKTFPKDEIFGLVSQMRRASVSITSNIAEGFGRHGFKERIQFYYLANGSLLEIKNQLMVARDVGYIQASDFDRISVQLVQAHKLLRGLISRSKTFLAPAS